MSRSQAVRELCGFALDRMDSSTQAAPAGRTIRVFRLGEEPPEDDALEAMPLGERVALVSELSLAAYAMRGDDVATGIRRDVVRVVRRGR